MTVLVEAKNIEVTSALRMHVERQAEKLKKIGNRITDIRVFLETVPKKNNDPHSNKVTFKVSVPGRDVVVIKQGVDMYEAVVEAARGAFRKVRKTTEKRTTKARKVDRDEVMVSPLTRK